MCLFFCSPKSRKRRPLRQEPKQQPSPAQRLLPRPQRRRGVGPQRKSPPPKREQLPLVRHPPREAGRRRKRNRKSGSGGRRNHTQRASNGKHSNTRYRAKDAVYRSGNFAVKICLPRPSPTKIKPKYLVYMACTYIYDLYIPNLSLATKIRLCENLRPKYFPDLLYLQGEDCMYSTTLDF